MLLADSFCTFLKFFLFQLHAKLGKPKCRKEVPKLAFLGKQVAAVETLTAFSLRALESIIVVDLEQSIHLQGIARLA